MRSALTMIRPGALIRVIALLSAVVAGPVAAELPRNPQAADDARYSCDSSGSIEQIAARARTFGRAVYDRNKLGCAADLLYAAASHGHPDAALLTDAILAHDTYLEQVSIERDLDFIGVQDGEWTARFGHAGEQVKELMGAAEKMFSSDPALTTARAQADLLVHRYDDSKAYVDATKRVISLFDGVIAVSPNVLDGAALVCLGKLYFDLPALFGGSSTRAVDLLERARAIDPHDSRRLSWLASAYEEEGQPENAKTVLSELLLVKPQDANRQYVADAWMVGIGLSYRLHDDSLLNSFESKRRALFESHPELLTRARTAVGGHGGEDPLTGKGQY